MDIAFCPSKVVDKARLYSLVVADKFRHIFCTVAKAAPQLRMVSTVNDSNGGLDLPGPRYSRIKMTGRSFFIKDLL